MYEQDMRGSSRHNPPRSNSEHNAARRPAGTNAHTADARARAKARARARARARKLAQIRAVLYVAVFAVSIFVLVTVMRSVDAGPERGAAKDTTGYVELNVPDTQPPELPDVTDPPVIPVQTHWDPVTFTADDMSYFSLKSFCRCDADYESLLLSPLNWDLTESNAKVLIIHTHTSEAYTPTPGYEYEADGEYRTNDNTRNMVAVGQRVKEVLEKHGVQVIHDTTDFEVPNTDHSYKTARPILEQHLRDNPDIALVLDIHRDAALTEDGNQWGPTITVDGERIARMGIAVGTGCYIGGNANWKNNMAIAMKMDAQLEKLYDGITRDIMQTSSTYNQDLPGNYLLVEIGAAGNTLEEALRGAECLAQAILELSSGTAPAGE